MNNFSIGSRVVFRSAENLNRILRTHHGELGTVKKIGNTANDKVLVCFDRSDDAFGIWWVAPENLTVVESRAQQSA